MPRPSLIAVTQGRRQGESGCRAAQRIGQREAHAALLVIRIAGEVGDAAQLFQVLPVRHVLALGPSQPLAHDRDHDQARIDTGQRLVVEAERGHHPTAVVLRDHVGMPDQVQKDLATAI